MRRENDPAREVLALDASAQRVVVSNTLTRTNASMDTVAEKYLLFTQPG